MARTPTPAVDYQRLTPEQLRTAGGAGATRLAAVDEARRSTGERIAADPSLTTFQAQRATQLADQDAMTQIDAINKETEAFLTQLMSDDNAKDYQAKDANSRRALEDMLALADIYFGGRGQSSSSRGFNLGYSG